MDPNNRIMTGWKEKVSFHAPTIAIVLGLDSAGASLWTSAWFLIAFVLVWAPVFDAVNRGNDG